MAAPRGGAMTRYVVLLRGINVGGKNTVPMASLKAELETLGYKNVSTYVNSGNVILESDASATELQARIDKTLPVKFRLDSDLVRVLALSAKQMKAVVDNRPKG